MKKQNDIIETGTDIVILKTLVLQDDPTASLASGHRFTLSADYEIARKNGQIDNVHIPRILLPITTNLFTIQRNDNGYLGYFGFGGVPLLPNYEGICFESKIIKGPDPQEITLEEIESKLGYSIKIVKEKK